MANSFTDHFKVDKKAFKATRALDPILDVDTKLFIDPHLLQFSKVEEVKASYADVTKYFAEILKLLSASKTKGDVCWRAAEARLTFHEFPGTCLGYARTGTHGSGIGAGLRDALLKTAKEIIDVGEKDPTLFELLGLFADDIGPDRISDMVVSIIGEKLVAFTERVCTALKVPTKKARIGELDASLPINPFNKQPVLLVPRDVLRKLPTATGGFDFDTSVADKVRRRLNKQVGRSWSEATKQQRKKIVLDDPALLAAMIKSYKRAKPEPYDFERDPDGEVAWYEASKSIAETAPLALGLAKDPTPDEVLAVVVKICEQFQKVIEENGLWKLLWDGNKTKHERAAQLLFYGVATFYCQANNLDLSPESNAGQGPVDFKVSHGAKAKVVVEVKLSHNPKLRQGYLKQLPAYRQAEGAQRGVYLVIDQRSPKSLAKFELLETSENQPKPKVIYVDATKKKSASKL